MSTLGLGTNIPCIFKGLMIMNVVFSEITLKKWRNDAIKTPANPQLNGNPKKLYRVPSDWEHVFPACSADL